MGKSGSNILHELLSKQPIGYRFTYKRLVDLAHAMGYSHINPGMATGFINRALSKGMVVETGETHREPKKGAQPLKVYALVDIKAWDFHGPTSGSPKGRTVNRTITKGDIMRETAEQLGLPVIDTPVTETPIEAMHGVPSKMEDFLKRVADANNMGPGEVLKHIIDTDPNKPEPVDQITKNYLDAHASMVDYGSQPELTDEDIHQMTKRDPIVVTGVNQAIMKMDEAVMPLSEQLLKIATQVEMLEHKSLSDYSDEELLTELKRRLK